MYIGIVYALQYENSQLVYPSETPSHNRNTPQKVTNHTTMGSPTASHANREIQFFKGSTVYIILTSIYAETGSLISPNADRGPQRPNFPTTPSSPIRPHNIDICLDRSIDDFGQSDSTLVGSEVNETQPIVAEKAGHFPEQSSFHQLAKLHDDLEYALQIGVSAAQKLNNHTELSFNHPHGPSPGQPTYPTAAHLGSYKPENPRTAADFQELSDLRETLEQLYEVGMDVIAEFNRNMQLGPRGPSPGKPTYPIPAPGPYKPPPPVQPRPRPNK